MRIISILSVLLLSLLTTSLCAQKEIATLDYDRLMSLEERALTYKDLLVQLAWLNAPRKKMLEHQQSAANEDVNLAKKAWTDLLRANVGIVPGGGRGDTVQVDNVVLFQPRLSFGATVDLGFLFTTKNEVNKAKALARVLDWEINEQKLEIRAETEKRYEEYLLTFEVLKARQKAEIDAEAVYQYFSELFKNGDGEFEDFNRASESYHNAVEGTLNARAEVQIAKIALEEMIGIRLEEAERLRKGRR
ncbi:MAG: TolC family protein [Bacteroidota bacterium]